MSYFTDLKEGDPIIAVFHLGEKGLGRHSGQVISNKYGVLTCMIPDNTFNLMNPTVFYTKGGVNIDGLDHGWIDIPDGCL